MPVQPGERLEFLDSDATQLESDTDTIETIPG